MNTFKPFFSRRGDIMVITAIVPSRLPVAEPWKPGNPVKGSSGEYRWISYEIRLKDDKGEISPKVIMRFKAEKANESLASMKKLATL